MINAFIGGWLICSLIVAGMLMPYDPSMAKAFHGGITSPRLMENLQKGLDTDSKIKLVLFGPVTLGATLVCMGCYIEEHIYRIEQALEKNSDQNKPIKEH